MTKKQQREFVYNKYNGMCAYCGEQLQKSWHVDEIEPCMRTFKYRRDEKGRIMTNAKGNDLKDVVIQYPERIHIDNQNPACASCNIQKHSQSLEAFRQQIKNFVNSLNLYSTQYKFAKRYNLVKETDIEVKFFFENFELTSPTKQPISNEHN